MACRKESARRHPPIIAQKGSENFLMPRRSHLRQKTFAPKMKKIRIKRERNALIWMET